MTTPITTIPELEALPAESLLRGGQPGYGPAYIVAWDAGDGRMLYSDCSERGYLEPAEVIRFHAPLTVVSPLPAPTVKPGRDAVLAALLSVEAGPSTNALADAVLAILPGKSEQEVRAGALRDAKARIALDFTFSGHEVAAWLDALADEEAGK